MAARTSKKYHDEKTKKLIGATQLLKRLYAHGNGEIEMSQSQIQAARIYIGKYIPDLKAMEITGSGGGPIQVEVVKFSESKTSSK